MSNPGLQHLPHASFAGRRAGAPLDAVATHSIDPALAGLARLERLATELHQLLGGVPRDTSRQELSAMWHLAHAIHELAVLMRRVQGRANATSSHRTAVVGVDEPMRGA